jgi:predicted PurR-regulated permease PerM
MTQAWRKIVVKSDWRRGGKVDRIPHRMEATGPKKFWRVEPLLGGLALLLLLTGCFFVLRPFLTALMWAIILAYSLHPLQRTFTRWFRGSRTLAACLVTLTVTIIFAGPVILIGVSIAQDGKDLALATRNWFMAAPEEPPAWVAQMPLVGDELADYWTGFAEDRNRWMDQLDKEVTTPPRPKIVVETGDGLVVQEPPAPVEDGAAEDTAAGNQKDESPHVVVLLGRMLAWARSWLISAGLAVGQGVTQVLVSAFLAFFLLRDAPELSERLAVAVERLAGDRGRHLIKVAGDTVRGVIYGILGTAIVQALVAGLGIWIAGVPGAVLLSVLTFFFAVVPFGPPLIWLPASLWLFAQDKPGLGVFMLLWGFLGISSVDNFLRPYLISQGSKMPFALIFCGVIGGALSFGLVWVFLGPTLLAVAFRLIEEWSSNRPETEVDLMPSEISELRGGTISAKPPHGGESLGVG